MNGIEGFAGSPTEGAVKLQQLLDRLHKLSSRRRHDVMFNPGSPTDELTIVVRVGGLADRDVVGTWSRRDSSLVFRMQDGIERTCDTAKEAETMMGRLLDDMLGPTPRKPPAPDH
jgi:hypothetical protein